MNRDEARRWCVAVQCFAAQWTIVLAYIFLDLPSPQRHFSYVVGGLGAVAAGTAASLMWTRRRGLT